jgi:hypothetical protein
MCQDRNAKPEPLELQARILSRNESAAAHNREHFLERGIFTVNVMGSPGSPCGTGR